MHRFLILSLLVLIGFSANAGGGWPQKKGHGYLKLGQYILRADRYFNPEGNVIDIQPKISVYTTSLYGEYGITERLTGILYLPFFSRSTLNNLQRRNGDFVEGDEVSSIGDTNLSFKYGLITNKPVVLSAMITLGIPLGEDRGGRTGTLQTGDGEFNQILSLEASRSFYPKPIYISASLGFNNRTENFSDEVRFGLEAGYTLGKFTGVARIAGVQSLMNGETSSNGNQAIFGNNIEYISFAPEIIYSHKENYGLSFSVATAFSGRQILANPAVDVGFFFKF